MIKSLKKYFKIRRS